MTTALDKAERLRGLFLNKDFLFHLAQGTYEVVQQLIDGLLEGNGEPAIHEVAAAVELLAGASDQLQFALGDVLVAVEERRSDLGFGEDWEEYLQELANMVYPLRSHQALRERYTVSKMSKGKRIPDKSYTWHRELVRIAGQAVPDGLGRLEHDEQKLEKVQELLEDKSEYTWTQLREEWKEAATRFKYQVPLPPYVEVIDVDTGMVEKFMDGSTSEAWWYILYRLGVLGNSPGLKLLTANSENIIDEEGCMVATVEGGEIAQRAWKQMKGRILATNSAE